MIAGIASYGAAAFKNNFRFKIGCRYFVRLKKRDWQKRNFIGCCYLMRHNPQGIYIFLIQPIMAILPMKDIQAQGGKVIITNIKNFIFPILYL
jgi:hypothetical protein